MKIMFDSNVFDKLPNFIEYICRSTVNHEYYITTIQVEELCEIPDSKIDVRKRNILMLADLRAKLVPASVCILGERARIGRVKLGQGTVYQQILNKNGSNRDDAIIADTAVSEGCTLVTADCRFLKKMHTYGYSAMDFDEFIHTLNM